MTSEDERIARWNWTLTSLLTFSVFLSAYQPACSEPVRIGVESRVEDNQRSHYNRYVNWRPANSETVHLNPPRMSWPYWPDFPNNWNDELHTFRLQHIAYTDNLQLDDFSVQVGSDVICFDPKSKFANKADFVIDISAFRE